MLSIVPAGSTGPRFDDAASSDLPFPCGKASFTFEHLPSSDLSTLINHSRLESSDEAFRTDGLNRSSLISSLEEQLRAASVLTWEVHNGKGAFPDRSGAELLSYRDDLYVYGGMPTRLFAARFARHPAWFKNDFPYMLKLNPTNCAWEPVSTKGLPKTWRWRNQSALARGVVHEGRLLVVGEFEDMVQVRIVVYDFEKEEWEVWALPQAPPALSCVLVDVYNNQMIQYGGVLRGEATWVDAEHALWTFDFTHRAWTHRQATGPLPDPAKTRGLAVVGDCAYVLVNHTWNPMHPHLPDSTRRMEVYVLDLKTWHWTQLPSQDSAPLCVTDIRPVIVQGHWLVFGGTGSDPISVTGNDLHDFDFATLTWTKAKTTGEPLFTRRSYYMATSHKGGMLVMGGIEHRLVMEDGDEFFADTEVIQQIWPQWLPSASAAQPDMSFPQYNVGQDVRDLCQERLFTDLIVRVEDRTWDLHRLVMAACSPLFKDILQILPPGQEWAMSDMTIDAMHLLVDWMYGHLRGNMAFEQCLTLFHISSRCQIAKLQRECVRVLKNYVNPKTVLQLHSLATVHDLCYLQEACQDLIAQLEQSEDASVAAQAWWSRLLTIDALDALPRKRRCDVTQSSDSRRAASFGRTAKASMADALPGKRLCNVTQSSDSRNKASFDGIAKASMDSSTRLYVDSSNSKSSDSDTRSCSGANRAVSPKTGMTPSTSNSYKSCESHPLSVNSHPIDWQDEGEDDWSGQGPEAQAAQSDALQEDKVSSSAAVEHNTALQPSPVEDCKQDAVSQSTPSNAVSEVQSEPSSSSACADEVSQEEEMDASPDKLGETEHNRVRRRGWRGVLLGAAVVGVGLIASSVFSTLAGSQTPARDSFRH